MKNKGITMTSLMIYVIGITIFMSVVIVTNTSLNTNFFRKQADSAISKEINKFNMYLSALTKENDNVSLIGDNVVFTNGDTLAFVDKNILKNNKKILGNVKNMIYNVKNINNNQVIKFEVTFNKYDTVVTKEFEYVLGRGY